MFPKSRAASARSRSFSSRETSSIPPHPARRRRRSSFTPSSISLKRLRTGRRHRETTTIPGGARGGRALNATQEHPRSGESHGPPRAVSSTRPRTRSVASCAGRASGSAANTVGRLLKKLDFALHVNKKTLSSGSGVDRDRQFRCIPSARKQFECLGLPVISVDTKKREMIGQFKNAGDKWAQAATPVYDHDTTTTSERMR